MRRARLFTCRLLTCCRPIHVGSCAIWHDQRVEGPCVRCAVPVCVRALSSFVQRGKRLLPTGASDTGKKNGSHVHVATTSGQPRPYTTTTLLLIPGSLSSYPSPSVHPTYELRLSFRHRRALPPCSMSAFFSSIVLEEFNRWSELTVARAREFICRSKSSHAEMSPPEERVDLAGSTDAEGGGVRRTTRRRGVEAMV